LIIPGLFRFKAMMLFDTDQLRLTWKEVPTDIDTNHLTELQRDYPTVLHSEDGTYLWLSRLPSGDRRINTPYETEYARWIPGDPWQALIGLVVLGSHHEPLLAHLSSLISGCSGVSWRLEGE